MVTDVPGCSGDDGRDRLAAAEGRSHAQRRPARVAEVAGECIPGVGNESEAAFAKAFKRSLGVSPGALVASVRSDVQTE